MRRSLFENYEPEAARSQRLRPNIFAILTQFSAEYAWGVVLFWFIITTACTLYSIKHLNTNLFQNVSFNKINKPARDMARFEQNFPNLYGMSNLTLSSKNSETIKQVRKELQGKLEDRPDLFATVLSPGAGGYYDVNGLLYLSPEQVKAHVAYALALHPLFQAVAEQPTTESLATLINQVSASIELGRDPQGLDDLLREAAKSTQSLLKGIQRPVDWTVVAGLNADPHPLEAHFVVVPKPGMNAAANAFFDAAAKEVVRPFVQEVTITEELGAADEKAEAPKTIATNITPLIVIATVLAAFVFFALLGQFSLAAMLASPALVTLSVASALFTLILPGSVLSFWLVILSLALSSLHFSARLTFACLEAFTAARARTSALMLAAQKQGRVVAWLWPVMLAPWAGWALIGDHMFLWLTVIASLSLLIGFLASIMLVPAIATLTPGAIQWTAAEWLLPIYDGFFENSTWRFLMRALAIISVIAAGAGFWFAPNLLPKNTAIMGGAEKPVYVLAENQADVDRILNSLKSVPEAEKVQWLGTFLPSRFVEKKASLAALKDQFSLTTPLQPQDPAILRDQISILRDSLQTIATSPATRPALASAANEFRQSLELLSATSEDREVLLFEKRMFGAFNVLPQRAEALAVISQPNFEALDPRLKSLFFSPQGVFRLTVSAKPGASQFALVEKLADLGLSVVSPSLVATAHTSQVLHSSLIIVAVAVSLGLAALAIGLRQLSGLLVFAITTAIFLGVAALLAVWRHETAEPLPLLLITIALSNLLALCATTSLKHPISNRVVPQPINATEAWVIPLLITALALPTLLMKAGSNAMPLIDLAVLLCAATAISSGVVQPMVGWLRENI